MNDIISGLNPNQKKAVEITDGPILIIAGAGSGKTKTLTHKVAYLIYKKGVRPENILAVTFTNKAAEEMRDRIGQLTSRLSSNQTTNSPLVGTFHSVCVRILRQEIHRIGYKKTFNIFDSQDQLSLVKKIMKELGISTDELNPFAVIGAMSKSKTNLVDENAYKNAVGDYFEERVARVYERYQAELRAINTLDFDDLIMLTVKTLRDNRKILEKYQEKFRYILVDEYQDTNHSQYVLINLLSTKHRNLCVVGDDWQSIYMFRGANIRNILSFEQDYPETKVFNLEQNYRSTQTILDTAYSIISKNENRKDKKLWTENLKGGPVSIYEAYDEVREAEFVASEIIRLSKKEGRSYSDFSVLYRTNAQSRILEEVFLGRSLPYKIIGGIQFYQRKEVKDVIAHLKLVNNPRDKVSLIRIMGSLKKGIGQKTLGLWFKLAEQKSMNPISFGSSLSESMSEITPSKLKVIQKFCDMIYRFSQDEYARSFKFSAFVEKIITDSGYLSSFNDGSVESEQKLENIRELFSVAKKYDRRTDALSLFLDEVSLVMDTDQINNEVDCVKLMTLHSAKGLEFPIVFIVGLEDGILPHSKSLLAKREMEEERRLMYVGITRAMEKLFLTHTKNRMIFGSTQINPPSRFIYDIPDQFTEKISVSKISKELKSADIVGLEIFNDGDYINHPDFGDGLVISSDNNFYTIAFKNTGIKKIAFSYPNLVKK